MIYFFYALHVLICIFLILVVLLQQGKGADLSVFGGGGTMTAFGARGAATVLHKLTVGSFVAFMVTTLAIGVMEGRRENSSVMSDVPIEESVDGQETEAEAPTGALADEEEDTGADGEATDEGTAADEGEAAEGAVSEDAPASGDGASPDDDTESQDS